METQKKNEPKLRKFKVLVPANRKYKHPLQKKLKKLEKEFENTPKECVLARQRILRKAEKLVKKF